MPAEHTVLATDGSQIEPDRHAAFPCYLINLGQVVLRYGPQPYARLSSQAHVAVTGLPVEPDNEGDEEGQVERLYLDLERSVAELRGLLELAADSSAEHPVLALLDGSLILWVATAMRYQRETDRYVSEYVACLEELRVLAQTRPLALASYISRSGSNEVMTKLRMAMSQNGSAGQRAYGEPLDRDLFASLQPGQRSDIYRSERGILEKYAPQNRVSFFYVNVGPEIGRGGATPVGGGEPRTGGLHPRRRLRPVPPQQRLPGSPYGGPRAGGGLARGEPGLLAAGKQAAAGRRPAGAGIGQSHQQARTLGMTAAYRPPSPGGRELEGGGTACTLTLTLSRQGRGNSARTLRMAK